MTASHYHNILRRFGIILFIPIILISCNTTESQLSCLEEQIVHLRNDQEYQKIKIAITDSIYCWSKQRVQYMEHYNDSLSTWIVDDYIFNEDRSKLFGWILKIDKDEVEDLSINGDRVDILDYVEYFVGEKRNGKWLIYLHNMPSIWFAREDNNSRPYSFDYLSGKAKKSVIEGGLFKKYSCDLNFTYINEWIERDGRDLYKWHQEFLKSGDK